ncbi:MAG TPA: hypothetical protein ENH78_01620 [Phycisphaerae bacterium]|nr:hypothetical protein [Phycisphaerae bacterium]
MRIGLRGVAGCGKTTVAKILGVRTGWPVVSIAEPMRAALELIGVPKEGNPTLYRALMQDIGAKCRENDPDWWASMFHEAYEGQGCLICDDVRYENEAGLFDAVFYLEPRGWTPSGEGMTPSRDRHESETWNATVPDSVIFNHDGRVMNAADAIIAKIERWPHKPERPTRHRIYVAGPYSADNHHDTAAHVREAVNAAERCWAKGHEAYCPHSHSHAIACRSTYENRSITYERWMAHSLGIIDDWATALLHNAQSPGADRELERALFLGHTIFHSVDEVPDVSEQRSQRQGVREDAGREGSTGAEEAQGEEEGAPHDDAGAASAAGAGCAGRAPGGDCACVSR